MNARNTTNFPSMISELKLAKNAAIEAGKIINKHYQTDYEIKEKGNHNPVTTADYAADSYLKDILSKSRPDYGWLSEETIDYHERINKE